MAEKEDEGNPGGLHVFLLWASLGGALRRDCKVFGHVLRAEVTLRVLLLHGRSHDAGNTLYSLCNEWQ